MTEVQGCIEWVTLVISQTFLLYSTCTLLPLLKGRPPLNPAKWTRTTQHNMPYCVFSVLHMTYNVAHYIHCKLYNYNIITCKYTCIHVCSLLNYPQAARFVGSQWAGPLVSGTPVLGDSLVAPGEVAASTGPLAAWEEELRGEGNGEVTGAKECYCRRSREKKRRLNYYYQATYRPSLEQMWSFNWRATQKNNRRPMLKQLYLTRAVTCVTWRDVNTCQLYYGMSSVGILHCNRSCACAKIK